MELNWPATVLVLGLTTLAVFRVPLARLLDRTEKVKDWLVATKQPALPAPSEQPLPTRDVAAEQQAIESLTQGFNSQLLLLQEEAIRADLATHGLFAEGACDKVLLRHLAGIQIALQFERIYATIYRSQVQALRWLNSQSVGVTATQIRPFYDEARAAWPSIYQSYDFQNWLIFIATQGLIAESDESAASSDDDEPFGLSITIRGRESLAYLVNGGRPDPSFG